MQKHKNILARNTNKIQGWSGLISPIVEATDCAAEDSPALEDDGAAAELLAITKKKKNCQYNRDGILYLAVTDSF
jgi:hypothetical protein